LRVLVLGGYGFIGLELVRALAVHGHDVIGAGRDPAIGERLFANVAWVRANLSALTTPESWAPTIMGVDVIVNAAGALQDGPRDKLDAVHHRSIAALIAAAERAGVTRFVQISAPGAKPTASTDFLRTKALGDAAVRASALDWIIFKPGLVLGRNAFGGTALLRMLAGFPLAQPLAHGGARLQTVSIDDVADAVLRAVEGGVASRADYDLVEDEANELRVIVKALRRCLGFAPARLEIDVPSFLSALLVVLADIAGQLGWRTSLRSTAMKVIAEDVLGDPAPWRAVIGRSLSPLEKTLALLPSAAQERVYARFQLVLPVIIAALSGFWIASGLLGAVELDRAAALLPQLDVGAAKSLVLGGAGLDGAVGAMLLWRRTAREGAIASAVVAGLYLILGTVLAPQIWLDPLGAYVKVIPVIVLSLALALMLEQR
jgi:uncharacterized protein YbjT (DUF2867 family)